MRKLCLLLVLLLFSLPSFAQEDELTPYEIALQRIQEAEASGATSLDLSGLGLTELPPEIGNLTNLEVLFLNDNRLASLPSEIGNLTILQYFNLADNQLANLPPEISRLNLLRVLDLRHNQLTSLPTEIGNLSKLCLLYLGYNQLQLLPSELSRIEDLRDYPCGIYLDDTHLISPPQSVIEQGTPAILDYLENEAWWHLQRLIISGATGFGMVVAFLLGMRWRHRGKKKRS